jgi:hypothetical protein
MYPLLHWLKPDAVVGDIIPAFVWPERQFARRWPFLLPVTSASAAAIGFLIENALWVFAAAFLLTAAALAVISKRDELRSAHRNAKPS